MEAEITCQKGQDARKILEPALSRHEERREAVADAQSKLTSPTEIGPAVEYPPDGIPAVGAPDVTPDVGGSSFHQSVDGETTEASNSEAAAIGECDGPPDAVVPSIRSGERESSPRKAPEQSSLR